MLAQYSPRLSLIHSAQLKDKNVSCQDKTCWAATQLQKRPFKCPKAHSELRVGLSRWIKPTAPILPGRSKTTPGQTLEAFPFLSPDFHGSCRRGDNRGGDPRHADHGGAAVPFVGAACLAQGRALLRRTALAVLSSWRDREDGSPSYA